MLPKVSGTVALTAILLIVVGCGKKESDARLVEIAIKVEKQRADVDRMARTLEAIERKLDASPESSKKGASSSLTPEVPEARQGAVDFRETPEYGKMVEALSAIQQQLGFMQTDFARTKEQIKRDRWTNQGQQWEALNHPREMTERLDALVENFAQQIDDPVARQQFEADIQQLRQINSDSLSTQELSQWLASTLNQRWNDAQDEEARKWIEHQLSDLASPSEGNLDAAVARVRSDINRIRLGEMIATHHIPREALNDAGLPDPNKPRGVFNLAIETVSGGVIFSEGAAEGEPETLDVQYKHIRIKPEPEMKAESKEESGNPRKS
jgi:hypothetical protein